MATNPIYVETEEEIPELVERLRRYHGEDTMLVLPMRSRIGQSRFNFQLLRNYSARLGKRVTVVCDDPAVQKMASETGFPVFGAVGPAGEGIPSEAEAPAPVRKWWQRRQVEATTHVGVAAPTRLITKTATELKPGRFLLYVTAVTLILVGIFAAAVFVPSASVTLIAQAQPFSTKDVEISAQPGKAPIHVRAITITSSNSQGFKVTGSIDVPLAPSTGVVTYTNTINTPHCPGLDCGSPGINIPYGQRLMNTNGLEFAQTSGTVLVPWQTGGNPGTANANVAAVQPGSAGNVGDHTITKIEGNPYPGLSVTNQLATGNGTDPSSTPQMTEADFDAGRAQLEQEIHQTIAQQIQGAGQAGEKLSDTLIFSAPQYTTDHQPGDKVPTFSGTMTITGEGDFYSDSDVSTAYKTYLAQHVPNNLQLLTESPTQVQYRLLSSAKGGYLVFVGTASAYVAPTLDEHQIRAAIVGRPTAQARFYLEKLPIRSVAIKEEPLALPLMPLLDKRITLHYVIASNTPSASTASQGSAKPSPSPSHSP
ncbi:MAG TPA: baseplate J/gp47 family protein [Candidatus Dormibacteraeota bacterium]|nr:baseplate J/gp47 family protein [Candidatus Dormibacteraeota bacterium]